MQPNFTKFLCMLPIAMARSFSDVIVIHIHYVLPVLRMMSCFHTIGLMGGWTRCSVVCHVVMLVGMDGQAWATAPNRLSRQAFWGSWGHVGRAAHAGRGIGYLVVCIYPCA